jgi:hypothetical protein
MLKMAKLCYSQQYFGHLPYIGFFFLILLKDNDLLFLKNILDINCLGFLYPNIISE